jgi:hypothetical protein
MHPAMLFTPSFPRKRESMFGCRVRVEMDFRLRENDEVKGGVA